MNWNSSIYTIWADAINPFKRKPKKEVKYRGKLVYVPKLKMNVKIHEGYTIQDWIKNYCKSNPHMKRSLYAEYEIPID